MGRRPRGDTVLRCRMMPESRHDEVTYKLIDLSNEEYERFRDLVNQEIEDAMTAMCRRLHRDRQNRERQCRESEQQRSRSLGDAARRIRERKARNGRSKRD